MVLGIYYLTMDPTVEIVTLPGRADEFRTVDSVYEPNRKIGIPYRANGYYWMQNRNIPGVVLFEDIIEEQESGRKKVLETGVDRTIQAVLSGEVDAMIANGYEMYELLRKRGMVGQLVLSNIHERRHVSDMDEVESLYNLGLVSLHTPILLGNIYDEQSPQEEAELTTVGRAIFNRILPDEMRFVQKTLGKKELQELVDASFRKLGQDRTTDVVDAIKDLGFHYATVSGTTIAVSDLTIPDERAAILKEAEDIVDRNDRDFRRGLMTDEERYQNTVEAWTVAKDRLQEVIRTTLNPYGPIAVMALSGSTKGGFGPITQLAGMRGLMADPSGRIIDLPIRSHFREGLDSAGILHFHAWRAQGSGRHRAAYSRRRLSHAPPG